MNKLPLLFFVFFLTGYIFIAPYEASAGENYSATAPILDTAEKFFISLKQKQYGVVWDLLSTKSHNTIINDIFKASKKAGENLEEDFIKNNFEEKGALFFSYWDAFLAEFDPDMVLEDSRWETGAVNKDEAEIIILYKKSENPLILQMFKENGVWKVGFSETFRTRLF